MVVALALGEPMEIANLVGKRHHRESISIQRFANRGVIKAPAMQDRPTLRAVQARSTCSMVSKASGTASLPPRMSSLEIAELTGKNHADVIRDIKKMVKGLDEGLASRLAGYYKASNGKPNPCFNLPRREADALHTNTEPEDTQTMRCNCALSHKCAIPDRLATLFAQYSYTSRLRSLTSNSTLLTFTHQHNNKDR